MLENMGDPQDQHISIEEIATPIGDQLFDFCESELFPETLQNSEVASSSNCCYEEQSSYPTQVIAAGENEIKQATQAGTEERCGGSSAGPSTPTTTAADARNSSFSIIFDDDQIENDISASIDFTPSPLFSAPHHHPYLSGGSGGGGGVSNQEPFGISALNSQFTLGDMVGGGGSLPAFHQWTTMAAPPPGAIPMLAPTPLPASYDEECLPSYIRLRPSQPACSLMDPIMAPFLPSGAVSCPPFTAESAGMFGRGGLMLGTDLSHQDLDFQGDNGGLYLPDPMPRVFNCSNELQSLSSESQHLVHGVSSATPLASEISSLDDPTFKAGKLSVEERRRKIHRYMKKRNERNFSKKIKYACRKTLADSRPRVRGRFAKNDELGELARITGSNHEDDADNDVSMFSNSIPSQQIKVGMKDEDLDSSDIFAHISGVNSFKCNYPIQSWI